jgi:hypothetical protein
VYEIRSRARFSKAETRILEQFWKLGTCAVREILDSLPVDERVAYTTGAVVHGLGIGQNHDHLLRALREPAFNGLRHVDLVSPLLRADRVAVQRINHRIAGCLSFW